MFFALITICPGFFRPFFLFTPSAHAQGTGSNQSKPDLRDKTLQRCHGLKVADDSIWCKIVKSASNLSIVLPNHFVLVMTPQLTTSKVVEMSFHVYTLCFNDDTFD